MNNFKNQNEINNSNQVPIELIDMNKTNNKNNTLSKKSKFNQIAPKSALSSSQSQPSLQILNPSSSSIANSNVGDSTNSNSLAWSVSLSLSTHSD